MRLQVSLELFLGQYHAWLAMDTKALLVVVPGNPLLNGLVTTVLFTVLAHQLSSAFNVICAALLPRALAADTVGTRLAFLATTVAVCIALAHLHLLPAA